MTSLAELNLRPPPARGRRPAETPAVSRREITSADLQALWDLPEGGLDSVVPPIKQLRHQHHMLARLLAEGRPETEASFITGYTCSRISVLKQDPAFKDLIAYYKSQVEEVFINVHERLAALGLDSVAELRDRLETKPDSFSHRELMELSELCFDRSGYGPSSTTKLQGTLALLSPETVAQIKSEVDRRQVGTIKTISPDHPRPQVGKVLSLQAPSGTQAAEGSSCSGSDLPAKSGEET